MKIRQLEIEAESEVARLKGLIKGDTLLRKKLDWQPSKSKKTAVHGNDEEIENEYVQHCFGVYIWSEMPR